MTNEGMVAAAKKQLGIDLACSPEAFDRDSNSVVEYRRLPARRPFSEKGTFFEMVSFGMGTVLTVNRSVRPFCDRYAESDIGTRLFAPSRLIELNRELNEHGYRLAEHYECSLPDLNRIPKDRPGGKIELFEQDRMQELYRYSGFRNALQYSTTCPRPDVLAAAIYENGVMCGIAGASRDSDTLWQIGIDVIPSMRRRGLGSELVAVLTREILRRGSIPYYGTWSANIASRRTALICGYVPTWVGVYSTEMEGSAEEAGA